MLQDSSPESVSASFSWYASDNLAAAAAKVSQEAISTAKTGDFCGGGKDQYQESEEFEFPANDEPLRSSDRFRFPIFKGGSDDHQDLSGKSPPSSSSSDSEDPERSSSRPAAARYCLWGRSTPEQSRAWCRKSKSTGSSMSRGCRLLSFRNPMKRSCSEGKKSSEFLNSNSVTRNCRNNTTIEKKNEESKTKTKVKNEKGVKIHDSFNYRKKTKNELEDKKRKSYLPYRQDLVGVFSGLNISGKTLSSRNH